MFKKRLLIYIIIVILFFLLVSLFVTPEWNNYKKIAKFILIGFLLCSTVYNIMKSNILMKILFGIVFIFCLGIGEMLEPTKGFILESDKYYVTKLGDLYLYRNYAMMDGYLLLYEKNKSFPILNFKASREVMTLDTDKVELKEIDGKIYIQINDRLSYLVNKDGNYWNIKDYKEY